MHYLSRIPRVVVGLIMLTLAAGGPASADDSATPRGAEGPGTPGKSNRCALRSGDGRIEHIVHIQFDNVHFRRDNPNVPSDLEQMPNLLNFIKDNGTLLNNHHTPLISHTSVDILTTLAGVYGEKMGMPIGNTILFFNADGSATFKSSFAYWTDALEPATATTPAVPQMVDQRGKIHPAPWVPFTRAGCDVGAFSVANIEFENTGGDVDNVFGPTSPEHNEVAAANALPNTPANAKARAKPAADFEGIAIHCALASPLCATAGAPDALPDEPGGYTGFKALFGNVNVAPEIANGASAVLDLDGNPVEDQFGNPGFPGFDPSPSQTLGYLASMLEAGVPVVYGYIEDAHDNHNFPSNPDGTFGPGEAGYVAQLKTFDTAFGKFFARLKRDGITRDNTLFIVTADENDHFAGGSPTPAGCDGIRTPCTYPLKGEVDASLTNLYFTEFNETKRFDIDFDDAPGIWIAGNPAQTDPVTRRFEREAGKLTAVNPILGGQTQPLAQALADHVEQGLLHMITSDPRRTPNFILFGNPDYFLSTSAPKTCSPLASCFSEPRNFAWNHGDFQEDITHTWLAMVGPGIRQTGVTNQPFSDHTDVRPTMLSLAGLKDDYAHDGRVLVEVLDEDALPESLRDNVGDFARLAAAYKAINAPLGPLGLKTLTGISTAALNGDDATYSTLEAKIVQLTADRNAIAGPMIEMLENAAFAGKPIDEHKARTLSDKAQSLLASVP
jgi:hypothetical protein